MSKGHKQNRSASKCRQLSGSANLSAAELVAKLAGQEKEEQSRLILAPVLQRNARVRVRIAGVVCELKLRDPEFSGWALLRMAAPGEAEVVGAPTQGQIAYYLRLFPRLRLIVLELHEDNWWCIPAQIDERLSGNSPVPLQMAERIAAFDTVYARCDGTYFFCEGPDRRRDPGIARRLRQLLSDNVAPDKLRVTGAVPQEKRAYQMLYLLKNQLIPKHQSPTERLAAALAHAGAELDGFWYQGETEHMAVRFRLDGQTRVATVKSSDLTVINAGICLVGEDQKFDLNSLVGVLREADAYQPDRHEHY